MVEDYNGSQDNDSPASPPAKATIRGIMALVVFIGGIMSILLTGSAAPFGVSFADDTTETIQQVEATTIRYQNSYAYQRHFIGQVEAGQTAQLGFEISGTLNAIKVDEGDAVTTGVVLATLDTARLQARKNEAAATVASAKANAKLAVSTYKRFENARAVNAVSAQERDEARETRDSSAAAVNVANARLQSVRVDLKKSSLKAPFTGTVIRRLVDTGTVLAAGQAVLELQQDTALEVRAGVTNRVSANLNIGDIQDIQINEVTYQAAVKAILPVRGVSRTVDIILNIQNDTPDIKRNIKPGDVARLPFDHDVTERGFWVPLTALKEGKRGLWSLYIAEETNGTLQAARRTVQVQYTGNGKAYVTGAVNTGDAVITKGAAKLVPGQHVQLAESDRNGQ